MFTKCSESEKHGIESGEDNKYLTEAGEWWISVILHRQ